MYESEPFVVRTLYSTRSYGTATLSAQYIYPLCKHFRFKTPEKPYPQYEKGANHIEWKRDVGKIKQNIIALLDKLAA